MKMAQMYIHRLIAFLLQTDLYRSTLWVNPFLRPDYDSRDEQHQPYAKNHEVVLQGHDHQKGYIDRLERSDLLLAHHQTQTESPMLSPSSMYLHDDGAYVDGYDTDEYDSEAYVIILRYWRRMY